MSVPELVWRAEGALRARGGRLLDRLGLGLDRLPLAEAAHPGLEGEALLFGRSPRPFLALEGDRPLELLSVLGESAETGGDSLSRRAIEDIPCRWNEDQESKRSFPLCHWSGIDYRRREDAEAIRRLWYSARSWQLPEIALDYFLRRDEETAGIAAACMRSWIEQCPPGRGIHWLVPLEMALRLNNWSYAARLLAGSEALAALAPHLARSVHLQAEQVRLRLSRYSSANNHLIGQAAGLVHAGTAFSGLRRAGEWRDAGLEIFWCEVLRQTTVDGVSREASTHYHEFVLELGLMVWLLVRASGEEPPPAVRDRLLRMLDFLADLDAFPGGSPELGDSDGQSALPFGGRNPKTLLALGAVLGPRGDGKARARGLSRQASILLGAAGRAAFESLSTDSSRSAAAAGTASRIYPEAGYAFLRDGKGEVAVVFDCAELGYLSTAAHAHADCLSFVLGAHGEHLLVDPGTYTYHSMPAFRDFFRSTAAHNTVRVDGEEQSEMRGAFLWGKRAHNRMVEWVSRAAVDLVAGEHDGYTRLPAPAVHRRTLVFVKPDYLWVIDELDGDGEHWIEQFLHFGATTVARGPSSASVLSRRLAGPALRVLVLDEPEPEIELMSGSERPLQGWVSPVFGERQPEVVWRRVSTRSSPSVMHLLCHPLASAAAAQNGGPESASVASFESGSALHAIGMPGEDLVCLAASATREMRGSVSGSGLLAGRAGLEGRLAVVRMAAGRHVALAGERLRRLEVGGLTRVETEGEPASFSLRRFGDRTVVEGRGGRLHLRGLGLGEVQNGEMTLEVEQTGDWQSFELPGEPAPGAQ